MKVESESNRSVKRMATIDGHSDNRSAPHRSSRNMVDDRSGRLRMLAGGLSNPSVHAAAVTTPMADRNASGFFRCVRYAATSRPTSRKAARWSSAPIRTSVAGSPTTMPALRRPRKVSSNPMPPAAAARSDGGIASATRSRSGVTDTTRKSTPAQNTMPSAVGQGIWCCSTSVKAKKALRPMPGATANGSFA